MRANKKQPPKLSRKTLLHIVPSAECQEHVVQQQELNDIWLMNFSNKNVLKVRGLKHSVKLSKVYKKCTRAVKGLFLCYQSSFKVK